MLADRTFRLAAVLAASLALVACGETTRIKPTSKATPRIVATVTPTVLPEPTSAAPSPTESASTAPATGGNKVRTDSGTNRFVPGTLTVKAGTTVTWTADQPFHTVTSGEPGKADPSGPMNALFGFTTYSVTFANPGTYKYFCRPHGGLGMVGEIVVT